MSDDNVIKPDVTISYAKDFLFQIYGIKTNTIKEANSYDDRNFIICADDGKEYVLKVSNIEESNHPFRIDYQNKVMQRLSGIGLPVQCPISSNEDQYLVKQIIETRLKKSGVTGKRAHSFRVLSFIPGIRICEDEVTVDAQLLHEAGRIIGNVDLALTKMFKDDLVPEVELWSLTAVPILREYVYACREERQRNLVLESIRRYETDVLPIIDQLTKGVIHGDPNEQNILVRKDNSSLVISGVLDWQDSHRCPIVFDLALLCMYMMSAYNSNWKVPEFQLPRHCIKGFNSVWNLSMNEIRILPTLVMARYAQSLCLGAHAYYILDPTNDYLLTTAQNGWRQLEYLCTMDANEIHNLWLQDETECA